MTIKTLYPNVRPTLDLAFAATKALDPRITFTRASAGTYVGSDGTLRTAGVNEARFDHSPLTLESLGLLVEEQRTNSITNNTMVGAVVGTPGTLPTGWSITAAANNISPEVTGIGTEDGITYVDIRYSGTSTGAGSVLILASLVTAITAAAGQSWTGSAYVKLQAGSLSNLTNTLYSVNGRSSIGASLESTNFNYTPTSNRLGVQRRTVSTTLANASTARVSHTIFNAAYASGAAIDITLRIGLPQLEQGAFATSVIPTTTAAATRSADVASITGSNFSFWYNQTEGTVFAEFGPYGNDGGSKNPGIVQIDSGSAVNTIRMFCEGSVSPVLAVDASSVNQAYISTGTLTPSATSKISGTYKINDFARAFNGSSPSTDSSGTVPTLSRMLIGTGSAGVSELCGTIRRLTFWPQALPSRLQALTQ